MPREMEINLLREKARQRLDEIETMRKKNAMENDRSFGEQDADAAQGGACEENDRRRSAFT